MSRIAKKPISVPVDVKVQITDNKVGFEGKNGKTDLVVHSDIQVELNNNLLSLTPKNDSKKTKALWGTMHSLLGNALTGCTTGFQKKLELVGVGYRAKLSGNILDLSLGFSHSVNHAIPAGITVEVPSNTEIIIKGSDKQKVGQVAADIRSYRPPEPYKGKGVKYSDETIIRKEAKKK
jgi:large subunit ribosomal protein L6